jgi:excisionase family DNA binding protein
MSISSNGLTEAERLVVSPRIACVMLNVGTTRLYQLIHAGELESYLDGKARKITVESIRRRIAHLLAAPGHAAAPQPRRRGRPRKNVVATPLETT